MKLLEKILLPTDFTSSSESSLKMAIAIAKTFDSEIIPLHVLPSVHVSQRVKETVHKDARTHLDRVQKRISESGACSSQPLLVVGSPFDQIIKLGETLNVNMIVLGAGEMEEGESFHLGNTPDKVIRKSTKPVLVVKQNAKPEIERILCPVDFSRPSARAVKNAIHVARNIHAQLAILSVISPLTTIFRGTSHLPEEEQEKYIKQKQEDFNRFLRDFDFHDVNWKQETRLGVPHEEILKFAELWHPDLIIMSATGSSGITRFLVGNVTERVLRRMPCSVAIVRSEDAVRVQIEQEISDLEESFNRATELLEKGFPQEAANMFQLCITYDKLFAAAWEGMGIAHQRMGQIEKAQTYLTRAKEIRKRLWEQKIQASVRSQHVLFKSSERKH